VNNHALVDGNKRLGWLATAVFLELNGINPTKISNNDVYELVMWLASTNPSLEDVTFRLSGLLTRPR
jgi:death-on-curing protein